MKQLKEDSALLAIWNYSIHLIVCQVSIRVETVRQAVFFLLSDRLRPFLPQRCCTKPQGRAWTQEHGEKLQEEAISGGCISTNCIL